MVRVEQIRQTIDNIVAQGKPTQIVHIPGNLNPADFATRPHESGLRKPIDQELIEQYKNTPWVPRVDRVNLMTLRARSQLPPNTHDHSEKEDSGSAESTFGDANITTVDRITTSQKRYPITMTEHHTYDQWDLIRHNDSLVILEQDVELHIWLIARHHNRTHRGISSWWFALRGSCISTTQPPKGAPPSDAFLRRFELYNVDKEKIDLTRP